MDVNWNQLRLNLLEGQDVVFRPTGHSMRPRVQPGQQVRIVPATLETIDAGDVVFCRVNGQFYLHLVRAKEASRGALIINARGHVNGWTRHIYGKAMV